MPPNVSLVTPQTAKEMLDYSHQLFLEMKTLATNPEATTEERERIPKMLKDAQEWKSRGVQLKEIMSAGLDKDSLSAIEHKGSDGKPSSFKSWGQFLEKVWQAGHPNFKGGPDSRLSYFKDEEAKALENKDMSGATGAGGGFLIPAEFQAQLQSAVADRSIVRGRATIIPMRRRQIDIPVLDQTATTAGQPHWFGGLRFYWAEEAGAKTESDAAFRQVSLVAHKLIGYTRASDELVDDSAISLEAFFSGPLGFAGGVAWMEDYAFLRGTGAGQPLGVIPAGCTIVEGRAAANAVGIDDIIDMLEHFLPGGRGVWVASQSVLPSIYGLNGPAGNPSYIWIPNAADKAPGTLFGYPLVFSEKPPALGTRGDIGIYDFAYYVIGDRQSTTVESTKFDKWSYDQTSWRVVHRVDGQPWLSTWLTLQDGTSTVSPFVILGEAVGS
jgi:HK97 family phage major capsid protein